jgi:lysophospholipase L1-like esterase
MPLNYPARLPDFIELGLPASIEVAAGSITVHGRTVAITKAKTFAMVPAPRMVIQNEQHILTDEKPDAYAKGTALRATLGPIDKELRLPGAIVPDSVRVYDSVPREPFVYQEGLDYYLDRFWGGICRLPDGRIRGDQPVSIDYEVWLQQIDLIQLDNNGSLSVKHGKAAPVCPPFPDADAEHVALAHIYIPYGTVRISHDNLYRLPEDHTTWRDHIRSCGRSRLQGVLRKLTEGEDVTIVCWGDSVTAGCSASTLEKSYVGLLQRRLAALYPKARVNIVNAGIGATDTSSRVQSFHSDVLAHNPDLITVEFVNDVWLPIEAVRTNWRRFIAEARAYDQDIEFILLSPSYMMADWMGRFQEFVDELCAVASECGTAVGDTANIWNNLRAVGVPYEALLSNLINHPNDLGHEFFAETILSLLRPH